MATLTHDAKRVIRGYEPVFRSILTRWLEANLDATGSTNPSVEDVSAGVAHVFSAIQQGVEVRGGNPEQAMSDYNEDKCYSWEEVRDGFREVAA